MAVIREVDQFKDSGLGERGKERWKESHRLSVEDYKHPDCVAPESESLLHSYDLSLPAAAGATVRQ